MKINIEIDNNKVYRWMSGSFEIISGIYLVVGATTLGYSNIGIMMMLLGIVNFIAGICDILYSREGNK